VSASPWDAGLKQHQLLPRRFPQAADAQLLILFVMGLEVPVMPRTARFDVKDLDLLPTRGVSDKNFHFPKSVPPIKFVNYLHHQ